MTGPSFQLLLPLDLTVHCTYYVYTSIFVILTFLLYCLFLLLIMFIVKLNFSFGHRVTEFVGQTQEF